MTETYSIVNVRRNLPTLIREAENDKAMEFTRHGEPVAILIGVRLFERFAAGRRSFVESYRDFQCVTDSSFARLE